jgi:TolB protein
MRAALTLTLPVVVTRLEEREGRFAADVYAVDPEDGEATRLTSAPGVDGDAAWSPDGSQLAFVSDRDRNGRCLFHDCTGFAPEIYVTNADGTEHRRLTRTTDYELFVINADGSCETRISDNAVSDWMPSWNGSGGKPIEC